MLGKKFLTVLALSLMICIAGTVYASVVEQNFEGGGTPYSDETNNTLQLISDSGNTIAEFKSDPNAWASSIVFDNITLGSQTQILSFDYQFVDFLSSSYDKNQIDFGGADYFRVSLLVPGFMDTEIYKHALSATDALISSPLDDWSITDSTQMAGFKHVELNLIDFINSNNLTGEEVKVYLEISNGFAYLYGNPLDYTDFNSTASLDNVMLGAQTSPVPEPAAYALFSFGIWFLVKRIKNKKF